MTRTQSKALAYAAGLVLLFAGGAQAATVIYSGQVASAVDNLVVDGVTYDVTFADVISGVGDTTFAGNSARAADALSALDAALNGTPAPFVNEAGLGSINQFIIQDNGVGNGIETTSLFNAHGWFNSGPVSGDDSTAIFTRPSTAATPLPAALPLFATGFGVISLIARRRRQKIAVANAAG